MMTEKYNLKPIQTKQSKRTNYDKITDSVESLASFLSVDWWCPKGYRITCENKDCKECIKEWLQKECE